MGMFDTIAVAEKLPITQEMIDLGLEEKLQEFQSKDLNCCLDLYFMQNGRLFVEKYKETKWIEGDKKAKSIFARLGHMERNDPYQEDTNFHGKVNFYNYIMDVAGKYDCMIEFCATYNKGQLEKIELVEFEKTDNTPRKERDLAWRKEADRIRNAWYNKYFKFYQIKKVVGYRFFYKPLIWLSIKISSLARFFL
jgi:hypothetical protein